MECSLRIGSTQYLAGKQEPWTGARSVSRNLEMGKIWGQRNLKWQGTGLTGQSGRRTEYECYTYVRMLLRIQVPGDDLHH